MQESRPGKNKKLHKPEMVVVASESDELASKLSRGALSGPRLSPRDMPFRMLAGVRSTASARTTLDRCTALSDARKPLTHR